MKNLNWYEIDNNKDIITPSLVVYPQRIVKNIQNMIEIAGGTENLRPHIKTHKIGEIIEIQMDLGIQKFKCATISEAELLALTGAKDILLALQPVGINIKRFFALMDQYPNSQFSTIVDNLGSIEMISKLASEKKTSVSLWLDLNNGMNRTGISPGKDAFMIYQKMYSNPNINAKGLHVYDGHIKESNFDLRKELCDIDFEPVIRLKKDLEKTGIRIETIIAGGTPTFPIHANKRNIETSPGTTILWDEGYGSLYKDLDFLPAAILLTRIISKPKSDLVCLDLGHKSIASEMKLPRAKFFGMEDCPHISQHEEHLVVQCKDSEIFKIGDILYGLPIHICPTISKYKNVVTVIDRKITGTWKVAARDYEMTI